MYVYLQDSGFTGRTIVLPVRFTSSEKLEVQNINVRSRKTFEEVIESMFCYDQDHTCEQTLGSSDTLKSSANCPYYHIKLDAI